MDNGENVIRELVNGLIAAVLVVCLLGFFLRWLGSPDFMESHNILVGVVVWTAGLAVGGVSVWWRLRR